MAQGPYQSPVGPPPPRKSGGMSTLMVVLLVFGVLGLVCCGGCVSCTYFAGRSAMGLGFTEFAMQRIRGNAEVANKFGDNLQQGMPTNSNVNLTEGAKSTVDFELTGSKGKGMVHAELITTKNGAEPTLIRVTAPDGTVINVPTAADPTNLNFDTGVSGPEGDGDQGHAVPEGTPASDATPADADKMDDETE